MGYYSYNPSDERFVAGCPRCLAEVSNKSYFAGPKGSAHFRGACSLSKLKAPTPEEAEALIRAHLERRPSSASAAAWISIVDYHKAMTTVLVKGRFGNERRAVPTILNRAEFEKFWGFAKINRPKQRVVKTLAKMGLAA